MGEAREVASKFVTGLIETWRLEEEVTTKQRDAMVDALSSALSSRDEEAARVAWTDAADLVELAELDDETGMVSYVHAKDCPGPCDYDCNPRGFEYDGMPLHQVLRHRASSGPEGKGGKRGA